MVHEVSCVAQTLRAAARLITRSYEDALRPVGLTASQYTVLQALNSFGAIGPSDLGEALAFDQTTATRLLAKLETQGLIAYAAHDKDSRRRLAKLTKLGQTRYDQAFPLWESVQIRTLDRISHEEWVSLRATLKQVSQG